MNKVKGKQQVKGDQSKLVCMRHRHKIMETAAASMYSGIDDHRVIAVAR